MTTITTATTDQKISKKCSMKFPKNETHTQFTKERTPAEHSFKMKTTYLSEHSSKLWKQMTKLPTSCSIHIYLYIYTYHATWVYIILVAMMIGIEKHTSWVWPETIIPVVTGPEVILYQVHTCHLYKAQKKKKNLNKISLGPNTNKRQVWKYTPPKEKTKKKRLPNTSSFSCMKKPKEKPIIG